MKQPTSEKAIQGILSRLTRLEKAVFKSVPDKGSGDADKASDSKALPAHILKLRDKDFFKGPKTAGEVREKLKSTYPCEHDRVAMALLRLQRRRLLRKSSKVIGDKKQLAYVW
jgi:hypothetical protein